MFPVIPAAGAYKLTFKTTDSTQQTLYDSGNTQTVIVGTYNVPIVSGWGFSGTIPNTPLKVGSVVVRDSNGTTIAQDNLGGGFAAGSYGAILFSTIDYATGYFYGIFGFPVGTLNSPWVASYETTGNNLLHDLHQVYVASNLPALPAGPTTLTIASRPIIPGTITYTDSSGTPKTFSDDGNGGWTGPNQPAASGTIDYNAGTVPGFSAPAGWTAPTIRSTKLKAGSINRSTGAYELELGGNTALGGNVTAYYDYARQLPVMGIHTWTDLSGSEYSVATDTRRLFLYNDARKQFVDVDGTDTWSGSDDDFFTFAAFENQLVLNNGVDQPKKYEPASGGAKISNMGNDFDGASGSLTIQSAKIFLRGPDNSGVYLSTKEDGVLYPQRARFTDPNAIEYQNASAATAELWADAPTEDVIVAAARLGQDILVAFRNEFWRLAYQGDPIAPWTWQRIPSSDGAVALKGLIELEEEVFGRGRTGLISSDGVGVTPVDLQVPDISLDWSSSAAKYTQAFHSREGRRVLVTYADQGDDFPQKALVMQYDDLKTERSFATYDFPFHTMGEYKRQSSTVWDDLTDQIDNYDFVLDDVSTTNAFPVMLAGTRTGTVYEWGNAQTDSGTPIDFDVETIRLNPYPFQRAHLGYLDLLFAWHNDNVFEIEIYGDQESDPYFTTTLNLGGTIEDGPVTSIVDGEKITRRISVNKIATWHKIRIRERTKTGVQIDAIIPYFRPSGPMRNVNP